METSNNPLMHELISKISGNTGISADKASEVLQTVSNFIKEKYPLLAGTVDSVLEINDDRESNEIQ